MANNTDDISVKGARLHVPRSRGAVSGVLLFLLGLWGALIPLLGPIVHFGFTPDSTWHFTAGRFWLEILPGLVTALGGLLLLVAANRITGSFGAWLAVAGGAWFIVGPALRSLLHLGTIGAPIHTSKLGSTLETLLLFSGLGALILFLASTALGRLGVISVGDVRAAQRRAADDAPVVDHDGEEAQRKRADKAERELADRDRADRERAQQDLAERNASTPTVATSTVTETVHTDPPVVAEQTSTSGGGATRVTPPSE